MPKIFNEKKSISIRFISLILLISLAFYGCAGLNTKDEKSAKDLAKEGMEKFKAGKYSQAIETFDNLKDWYPFSKYALLAELKTADAYYKLKEYQDAIFAYEDFESLHPRNEAVPDVIYQIGMCYLKQLDTIDRDQTPAQKALENFERLIREYPRNKYAEPAKSHIQVCYKSLAEHEFYIGSFYYKSKHYKAALKRFMRLLSDLPDVGVHKKALEYVALCEVAIKKQEIKKK
ncbi:outer membrane protein assembly factor BamD [Candidatus Magnetomoraceae bacterium gMMP-15]